MGEVFEKICLEYMWKAKLPFVASKIGRWWGNNPIKKAQQEIDIIAVNNDNTKAVYCECKWRNEKTSENVVDNLIEKASMFNHKEKYYYVFSMSGFTKSTINKATENDNIKLINFSDM